MLVFFILFNYVKQCGSVCETMSCCVMISMCYLAVSDEIIVLLSFQNLMHVYAALKS